MREVGLILGGKRVRVDTRAASCSSTVWQSACGLLAPSPTHEGGWL
jgi:hypothetical protein